MEEASLNVKHTHTERNNHTRRKQKFYEKKTIFGHRFDLAKPRKAKSNR